MIKYVLLLKNCPENVNNLIKLDSQLKGLANIYLRYLLVKIKLKYEQAKCNVQKWPVNKP